MRSAEPPSGSAEPTQEIGGAAQWVTTAHSLQGCGSWPHIVPSPPTLGPATPSRSGDNSIGQPSAHDALASRCQLRRRRRHCGA